LKANPTSRELSAALVTTQRNVGTVLMQMGQKTAAIKEFDDAIRIGRQLADDSDTNEHILDSLAVSYSSLGSLHDAGQPILAADAYRNAIAIERKLVKADPFNRLYQGDLARTYSNLGYLSSRTKDWKNAELCFSDAIQIQQNLVKVSPMTSVYRRDLAISYNNLGMAQRRGGRLTEAGSSFQKSVQLQDSLLASQPADVETRSNQGGVWNNLATLFDQQGRYADAEMPHQQAIASQRRALESAPANDRYRSLLSRHYLNFAQSLSKQGKYDAAVHAAVDRRHLWPGNAERLYSAAQQLANMYGVMHAANASQPSQAACLRAAVDTLREAVAAGLPKDRLKDSSLANLAGTEDFRRLLDEITASAAVPRSAQPSVLSRTN
jgi:tetratricopeptide (TPR) repeat protein